MDTEKLEKLLVKNETLLRVISSLVGASHSNPEFISEKLSKFEQKHKEVLLEIERATEIKASRPGLLMDDSFMAERFRIDKKALDTLLKDCASNWETLAFDGEKMPEEVEEEEASNGFARIFNKLERDGPLREKLGWSVTVVDLLERKEQKQIKDQIQMIKNAFLKVDSSKKDNG